MRIILFSLISQAVEYSVKELFPLTQVYLSPLGVYYDNSEC